jgi:hypothetical protein
VIDQVLHPYETTGKIIVLRKSYLCVWLENWKIKDSAPNGKKIQNKTVDSTVLPQAEAKEGA